MWGRRGVSTVVAWPVGHGEGGVWRLRTARVVRVWGADTVSSKNELL